MQDRLTEIKAREAAATPGPWDVWVSFLNLGDEPREPTREDLDFINNSRVDTRYLISEVERLRAENERLKRER